MRVVIPSNTSLLRLVINNSRAFYPQDWYYDEEFANYSTGEDSYVINFRTVGRNIPLYSATELAYVHIIHGPILPSSYLWTRDTDDKQDKVYVGMSVGGRKPGLQIHRHLTINPDHFLNSLEGR